MSSGGHHHRTTHNHTPLITLDDLIRHYGSSLRLHHMFQQRQLALLLARGGTRIGNYVTTDRMCQRVVFPVYASPTKWGNVFVYTPLDGEEA